MILKLRKYKIKISPESAEINTLQSGDIVNRQYFDGKNIIYSLMYVENTGIDMVADKDGVKKEAPYFIGQLLFGDEPKTGELLNFVRVTSLSNSARGGALYLTSSDSNSPYLDVINVVDKNSAVFSLNGLGSFDIPDTKTTHIQNSDEYVTEVTSSWGEAGMEFPLLNNSPHGNIVKDPVLIGFMSIKPSKDTVMEVFGTEFNLKGDEFNDIFMPIDSSDMMGSDLSLSIHLPSIGEVGDYFSIRNLIFVPMSAMTGFDNGTKTRIGQLSGIVDEYFGALDSYGAYFQKIYATKDVNIAGTLTAGSKDGQQAIFYVGKIRTNAFMNSMSIRMKDNSADIYDSKTNPVGIGNVYKSKKDSSFYANNDSIWHSVNSGALVCFSMFIMPTLDEDNYVNISAGGIDTSVNVTPNIWNRVYFYFSLPEDSKETVITLRNADVLFCAPQLELGVSPSIYQPTDEVSLLDYNNKPADYGMWATKGGFGGTIQNPIVKLNDEGVFIGDAIQATRDGVKINLKKTGVDDAINKRAEETETRFEIKEGQISSTVTKLESSLEESRKEVAKAEQTVKDAESIKTSSEQELKDAKDELKKAQEVALSNTAATGQAKDDAEQAVKDAQQKVEDAQSKADLAANEAAKAKAEADKAALAQKDVTQKQTEIIQTAEEIKITASSVTTSANAASESANEAAIKAEEATLQAEEADKKAKEALASSGASSTAYLNAKKEAEKAFEEASIAADKATEASKSAEDAQSSLEVVTKKETNILQTAEKIESTAVKVESDASTASSNALKAQQEATKSAKSATDAQKNATSAQTQADNAEQMALEAAEKAEEALASAGESSSAYLNAKAEADKANKDALSAKEQASLADKKAALAKGEADRAKIEADKAADINTNITELNTQITQTAEGITTTATEVSKQAGVATEASLKAENEAAKAESEATKAGKNAEDANSKALEATEKAEEALASAGASSQSYLDAKAEADKAVSEALKANSEAGKAQAEAKKAKTEADKALASQNAIAIKQTEINQTSEAISLKATEVSENSKKAIDASTTATAKANEASANAVKAKTDAATATKKATEANKKAEEAKASAGTSSKAYQDAKAEAVKANADATKANTEATKSANEAAKAKVEADKAAISLKNVTEKEAYITTTSEGVEIKAKESRESADRAVKAEASINVKADGIVMQASSESAKKAIDGLEIGGVNLLLNSSIEKSGSNVDEGNRKTIWNDETAFYEGNSNYVFSFDAKGSGSLLFIISEYTYPVSTVASNGAIGSDNGGTLEIQLTEGYKRHWVKIKTGDWRWLVKNTSLFILNESSGTVTNFKLEKGNKPTDWSPAPEDQQAELKKEITSVRTDFEIAEGQINGKLQETTQLLTESKTLSGETKQTLESTTARVNEFNLTTKKFEGTLGEITKKQGEVEGSILAVQGTAKGLEASVNGFKETEREIKDTATRIEATHQGIVLEASEKSAQKAISDLKIGGVNLIPNSANPVFYNNGSEQIVNFSPIKKGVRMTLAKGVGANTHTSYFIKDKFTQAYVITCIITTHSSGLTLYNGWKRLDDGLRYIPPSTTTRVIFKGIFDSDNARVLGFFAQFQSLKIGDYFDLTDYMLELGNKPSLSWSPAPEDVQSQITKSKEEAEVAAKAYADAQDNLKQIESKAYADDRVTEEEKRAIADAKAKLDASKAYADAQDTLLKTQQEAYADGKVTAEEQRAIEDAKAKLEAANKYAEAQDNLLKTQQEAYADGKVTESEKRAIADATNKVNAAKSELNTSISKAEQTALLAQKSVDGLEIGGVNLIPNSANPVFYNNGSEQIVNFSPIKKGVRMTLAKGVGANTFTSYFIKDKFTQAYVITCIITTHSSGLTLYNGWKRLDDGLLYIPPSTTTRVIFKGVFDSNNVRVIGFFARYEGTKIGDYLDLTDYMLELGNKPSLSWSPAPEDYDAKFTETHASLKVLNDKIASEVSKTNGIRTDLTTLSQSHNEFKVQVKSDISGAIGSNNEVIKSSFEMKDNVLTAYGKEFNILAELKVGNETILTEDGKIRTKLLDVVDIVAKGVRTNHIEGLTLNFKQGAIGGWKITANTIENTNIVLEGSGGIKAKNGKWVLGQDGSAKFTSGEIGGWKINNDVLESVSMTLNPLGGISTKTNLWALNADGTAFFGRGIDSVGSHIMDITKTDVVLGGLFHIDKDWIKAYPPEMPPSETYAKLMDLNEVRIGFYKKEPNYLSRAVFGSQALSTVSGINCLIDLEHSSNSSYTGGIRINMTYSEKGWDDTTYPPPAINIVSKNTNLTTTPGHQMTGISLNGSNIAGFGLRIRIVPSGVSDEKLLDSDSYVMFEGNTNVVYYIPLPAETWVGRVFMVYNNGEKWCQAQCKGKSGATGIYNSVFRYGNNRRSGKWSLNDGQVGFMINDGYTWNCSYFDWSGSQW